MKVYVLKDIFGILVVAKVNVINHVTLVSIQIMKIVNVEKSWWINQQRNVMKILKKQVQLKLIRQSANIIFAYCTWCCFQYSLQSTLEQVLILFTINTTIVIKKMSLQMIMFIMQKIINHMCIKYTSCKQHIKWM